MLQVRQGERECDGEGDAEEGRDTDGADRHEAEEVPLRLHVARTGTWPPRYPGQ